MLRQLTFVGVVSVLPASGSTAQETISCQVQDSATAVCTIIEPDVRRAEVAYPRITVVPGDRVTVSATGCAQTGGAGLTWKRYADPQGAGSDQRYYGSFFLPGTTPAPVRFVPPPQTLVVQHAAALHLRYTDDSYGDNGYHGRVGFFGSRDDGTGGQCRDMGNARVQVKIERSNAASLPAFGPEPNPRSPGIVPATSTSGSESADAADHDGDGADDQTEMALAERFAPIFFYEADEPNLPIRVERFLTQTAIGFYDAGCGPETQIGVEAPAEQDLPALAYTSPCLGRSVHSGRHRSPDKQHTFFLRDGPPAARAGAPEPGDWVTYVHVYPNVHGGLTLPYWRFHAYNTGRTVAGLELGFHGGDWEGVQIALDGGDQPLQARYLGHTEIARRPWGEVPREGDRPLVLVERGGHASSPLFGPTVGRIRHESHSGGTVTRPGAPAAPGGGLAPLGEKTYPARAFLAYAGLWGSPGYNFAAGSAGGLVSNFSSGYWGPAFNETEMSPSGFITAWCEGTSQPERVRAEIRECYAPPP